MGFASGSVSFRRFAVVGEQPEQIDQDLLDKLAEHALRPGEVGVPEEIEYGWAGGRHVLDGTFSFENNVYADALFFALRVDSNKVPGDLKRAPPWVAPHQPRLDWQMWFAALSDYRLNSWFIGFLIRLLQGSAPVLALLKHNPFPNSPPIYVRAVVYDYHFTTFAQRRTTGAWWTREKRWLYCPVYSLRGPETELASFDDL